MAALNPSEMSSERQIREDAATSEAEWRAWLARAEILELPEPISARADSRLVVVAPHPDDEVLACGGLLAAHVERGGKVAIIGVTDGEASHGDDPRWPPGPLGLARRGERVKGLAQLGVDAEAVTRIGIRDGEVTRQHRLLHHSLTALLRPDDVVITTWQLDGHPDHEACGRVVGSVCAALGCTQLQAPVWMWQWSRPADTRVPWTRLRSFTLPGAALARKTKALVEHRTQLSRRAQTGPVLGPAILARATRATEYFFV